MSSLFNNPQLITVCELWIKFYPDDADEYVHVFSTDTGDFQILWNRINAHIKLNNIKKYSVEYKTSNTYKDYDY
jgi:hypothetical protein